MGIAIAGTLNDNLLGGYLVAKQPTMVTSYHAAPEALDYSLRKTCKGFWV